MGRLRNRGCWYLSTKEPAPPICAGPSPLPKRLAHRKKSGLCVPQPGRRRWAGRSPVPVLSCPQPSPSSCLGARSAKRAPRTTGSTALLPPTSHLRPPLGRPAASPGCRSVGCCHVPVGRKSCFGHMCCCRWNPKANPAPASGRPRAAPSLALAAAAFPLWATLCRPLLLAVRLYLLTLVNYWYLTRFSSLRWQDKTNAVSLDLLFSCLWSPLGNLCCC